ncbi:hypothetical protein MKEN_00364000 [Mycena kentingensis (nom. inval.)]|nr:hypothetical protein MKEN_00364000 [Mycena kentingensis (nom. inval.)]
MRSQTLYTAKFYDDTPSSSGASLKTPDAAAYLDKLFAMHIAAQNFPEVPSSRPATPDSEVERVDAVNAQVKLMYEDAKGNPASGKWGVLATVLQTSYSCGRYADRYKYVETTTRGTPLEPPSPNGWPELPANDEDWEEWEQTVARQRQRQQERQRALATKVEDWKRDISDDAGNHVNDPPNPLSTRRISDIPEVPFFPPSFPTHLETSTPPAPHRRQPSPIILAPESPLTSPADTPVAGPSKLQSKATASPLRVYGRSRPRPPPRKRELSLEPAEASPAKKARTISEVPDSVQSASPTKPFTPPKRNNLPKLADLIAASEQKKRFKGKVKAKTPLPLARTPSVASSQRAVSPSKPKSRSPDVPTKFKSRSRSPAEMVPETEQEMSPPPAEGQPISRSRSSKSPAEMPDMSIPPAEGQPISPSPPQKSRASKSPDQAMSPPPAEGQPVSNSSRTSEKRKSPEMMSDAGKRKSKSPQRISNPSRASSKRNSLSPVETKLTADKRTTKSPEATSSPSARPETPEKKKKTPSMEEMFDWDAAAEEQLAAIPPIPSPTKSLSSIDGSNSVESDESRAGLPKYSDFDPQGASTQPLSRLESLGDYRALRGFGNMANSSFGYPMQFESQLDVESNMQGVERLLDADVGGYSAPWAAGEDEQWDARADEVPDSSP